MRKIIWKCECGNDSFRIIEKVVHDPEYGWESEGVYKTCNKCGKEYSCIEDMDRNEGEIK